MTDDNEAITIAQLTLNELCSGSHLDEQFVVQCVEVGIVQCSPAGQARRQWRFSSQSVLRLEKARRLQRDLEMDLHDLALVLDLLDEVDALRGEVGSLRRRLDHWESDKG